MRLVSILDGEEGDSCIVVVDVVIVFVAGRNVAGTRRVQCL